jgi:hypothetical protein
MEINRSELFNGIKLDIKPIHYDFLTCFEDSIVTVAEWSGYRYELMFSEDWNFVFNFEKSRLNKNLGQSIEVTSHDIKNKLDKFHGIKIESVEISSEKVTKVIIDELKNKKPIIVFVDSFWCPWDWFFQKRHNDHAFLVTGFDDTEKFYCCDCFYQTNNIITGEELRKGFIGRTEVFSFEGNEKIYVNWSNVLQIVLNRLRDGDRGLNAFDSMRYFADVLESLTDLQNEILGCEEYLFSAPLVSNLEYIAYGRRRFARLLDYFEEEIGIKYLQELANRLRKVAIQWANIRLMLIKLTFSYDALIKNRIVSKIREIAESEESMAEQMAEVLRSNINASHYFTNRCKTISMEEKKENLVSSNNVLMVDLSPYLNNQAFGNSISEKVTADLMGTGTYFLKGNLPDNDVWKVNKMKFKCPWLYNNGNDNISCNRQRININNKEIYQSIIILGCAEWGSFTDKLSIYYINGQVEEIYIKLTDCLYKPLYGETIAWEGKAVDKIGNHAQLRGGNVYITAKKYDIPRRDRIDFLQLPECPGIHLFAISLV